jgi:hypothetical protein
LWRNGRWGRCNRVSLGLRVGFGRVLLRVATDKRRGDQQGTKQSMISKFNSGTHGYLLMVSRAFKSIVATVWWRDLVLPY